MRVKETLSYVGILLLASSLSTTLTSPCGEFKFDSSDLVNGTLLVKEATRVNITFTIVNSNCSNKTYGEITIFKDDTENISIPKCKIRQTCNNVPVFLYMSCHCLDTPGFYNFSFVAKRKDNGLWKWSATNVSDAVITFNITYRASVTRLEIMGYDQYISNYKTVSVVCTWENGNPPTRALLLDRHNYPLVIGDMSGNISYAFSPILCRHAGVIRCEADGSDRNMSTTMLIECPPEFGRTSSIKNLNIGQNADVTFPFRSHTPNISSCHITQTLQNRNGDTNQYMPILSHCSKAEINESGAKGDNAHCLYYVTGEPPDLHLTISVRNLKGETGGVWYVNISNDVGSDGMYVQINTDEERKSTHTSSFIIFGYILGIAAFTDIIFITIYYINKGRDTFARLRSKGQKDTVVHGALDPDIAEDSQRQSEIYYEINDPPENGTQSPARTYPEDFSDFPFYERVHPGQVQSTNNTNLKRGDYYQPEHEENKNSNSTAKSTRIKRMEKDNSRPGLQHTCDCHSVQKNAPQVSDNFNFVQPENGTRSSLVRHLKIVQIGNETNLVTYR